MNIVLHFLAMELIAHPIERKKSRGFDLIYFFVKAGSFITGKFTARFLHLWHLEVKE